MTTARKPRIAVIGGGIAGVSAAWQLRQQLGDRAQLMLAEAYGRLGGKLKTVRFSTGPVDMGAEAFLSFDQQFMELIDKLGMSSELRTPSTAHSAFLVDGTFVDIPRETLMGIPVSADVASEILSPAEAARLDAERDGQPMTWNAGDDTTVGALVEARLGKAVVDKLVSPLLGGVYSCSAYDLGVRATLPQLAEALDRAGEGGQAFFLLDVVEELLAKRRATAVGGGGSPFRSFDKGYRSLIEEMMRQADPELILNSAVEELGRTSDGRWVIDPLGTVDAVVVATSAPTASVILEDAAPVAAEALGSVELSSSAVVGMRFASDHGIPERSGVLLGSNSGTAAKAADHGGAGPADRGVRRDTDGLVDDDDVVVRVQNGHALDRFGDHRGLCPGFGHLDLDPAHAGELVRLAHGATVQQDFALGGEVGDRGARDAQESRDAGVDAHAVQAVGDGEGADLTHRRTSRHRCWTPPRASIFPPGPRPGCRRSRCCGRPPRRSRSPRPPGTSRPR